MSKNIIDYIEIWPDDPEGYIRHACETWGLPPPVEYNPVHLDGNLVEALVIHQVVVATLHDQ